MAATHLLITLLIGLQAPQDRSETLARYRLDSKPAAITRGDLILDLARRNRRTPEGQEARQVLVDRVLIQRAAEARGLMPGASAIAAKLAQLEAAMKAGGEDLANILEKKGMSRAEFQRSYVTLVLAHERLVRAELELADGVEVSPAQLQLWLGEERGSMQIEMDPTKLPESVAARVGDKNIDSLSFGALLLESMDLEDRRERIRQIVLGRLLAARAKSLGIVVSEADARREVQSRKRQIEADPTYQGVSYEQLLQARGTTMDELARSEVTYANIQQRRIVLEEHSDAELQAELDRDRAAVLERHGPKRDVHIILLRASDPPNEFIPRTHAQTMEMALELRDKINKGIMRFSEAARLYSEEPQTKGRGGQVGRLSAKSSNLPPEVMTAAFASPAQRVPEPVPSDGGVFLVWIGEIDPPPTDRQLIAAMRAELAGKLQTELFSKAQLIFTF